MLNIILQILSVLGMILLALLIVAIILLLLVLFFPITYRFSGTRQEEILMKCKVNWLFGLVRVRYAYPEPAKITVKVLWITLYEALVPGAKEKTSSSSKKEVSGEENIPKNDDEISIKDESATVINADECESVSGAIPETSSGEKNDIPIETEDSETYTFYEKILKKIEHIKYTITNLCDKIKEIWKNINYYLELFQEESSKELFRHGFFRISKIFKSIRPRHLKADIVFGTGSPDTTGYAYAVYGILSSVLGSKFVMIPDFEQAVLKGELQFSGHITLCVLLIHALKLLFDKKLHRFIKKMKSGLPVKNTEKSRSEDNIEKA